MIDQTWAEQGQQQTCQRGWQLRNAGQRRNHFLQGGAHQLVVQCQTQYGPNRLYLGIPMLTHIHI